MRKKLVLHVGSDKAGSTTIQTHLFENREHLLLQGVLYPLSGIYSKSKHHKKITNALLGKKVENNPLKAPHIPKLESPDHEFSYYVAELKKEIENEASDYVVLSSEALFHNLYRKEHFEALKSAFSEFNVSIVVVVRDVKWWVKSRWSHNVRYKDKFAMSINEFARLLIQDGQVNYLDRVLLYEDVFGKDKVSLVFYDNAKRNVFDAFWTSSELPNSLKPTSFVREKNTTPVQGYINALYWINKLPFFYLRRGIRKGVRAMLSQGCSLEFSFAGTSFDDKVLCCLDSEWEKLKVYASIRENDI